MHHFAPMVANYTDNNFNIIFLTLLKWKFGVTDLLVPDSYKKLQNKA